MTSRIVRFFWPDLEAQELRKFTLLASIMFFIIGSYWALHLLKNIILYKIAFPESLGWPTNYGRLMQPIAKFWSPFIIIGLVCIYSKLVDWFEKDRLFYILCTAYAALFSGITCCLALRHFFGDAFLGKEFLAGLGFFSFFTIESFGSLLVALFWSFTSSITTSEQAKKGYPIIGCAAQLSGVLAAIPMIFHEHIGSIWIILSGVVVCILIIILFVYYFMRTMPASELIGNKKAAATENKKEGFIEGFVVGLRLLLTRPYLLAVLIISTFHDIIAQILEYQMQSNACYNPAFCSEQGFAYFQGIYCLAINIFSFLMALLGTRFLIKRFGVGFCLLFFPCVVGVLFLSLFTFFKLGNPTAGQLLWSTFGVMIFTKGLGFSVNIPVKEMLYIPTSKDVKFKSKGWVDMFGARSAKGVGAQITNTFKENLVDLMIYGTIISFGLTTIWIVAAIYIGNKHKQLIQEGSIIE